MMGRGCSPLGPVPVPPTPGSGPATAGMPLAWSPGLAFGAVVGFGGGFSGPAPVPVPQAALATASGSGAGGTLFAAGGRLAPLGYAGVTTGPNRDVRALASEVMPGGRSALGALAFGPFVAPSGGGIQAPLAPVGGSSFVVNATVSASVSMSANSGTSISVSAPGVLSTDAVSVAPTAPFGTGFGPLFAIAGGGTVTVFFVNCTTSTQNIAPGWTLRIGVIR